MNWLRQRQESVSASLSSASAPASVSTSAAASSMASAPAASSIASSDPPTSVSSAPSSSSASSIPPPPPSSSSTFSSTTTTTTSDPPSSSTTTSDPPSSSPSNVNSQSSPPDPPSSSNQAPSDPPTETLRSTVFVTTTDDQGRTTTSAPSIVTQVFTITSNGVAITTTETRVNPTLNSDGHSSGGSSFFKNTGAVVGVFVLVGLAAAAVLLFIVFGLRRRRRNRLREHDAAVSATLAAAGFQRAPLDDEDAHGSSSRHSRALPEMREGSALALGTVSSLPSGGRTSGYQDSPGPDEAEAFNPYTDYNATGAGYIPARTSTPPPTAFPEHYRDSTNNRSGSGPDHSYHHSASQSVGSTEPLLAAYNRPDPASTPPSGVRTRPPTPPPRNPKRSQISRAASPPPENRRHSVASSVYSSESTGDERLNPDLRNSEMQDSEDYSRRVLGVRNFPDGVSHASAES
ncbi:hypothetical protein R3P38DRAFT_2823310 [Favolaschia claudopus]|uniref:Uncharacterized protein n=1 Tax=Favolaschia claudopus TaxID=2862362 RepID=A0AAW0EIQ4_9AGAR